MRAGASRALERPAVVGQRWAEQERGVVRAWNVAIAPERPARSASVERISRTAFIQAGRASTRSSRERPNIPIHQG
ncbi:hypothetical protein [Paenibacillus elgii]|uniref:hypothetical protein n=1 Tax=Paenibacillus elgii TaxID=189691 RepID=UPI0012F733D9|nr:hypothetical protein [Paenibacillus elgii]